MFILSPKQFRAINDVNVLGGPAIGRIVLQMTQTSFALILYSPLLLSIAIQSSYDIALLILEIDHIILVLTS